jgi:diguanylate cyclase (GGDEF)-like protein
MASCWSRATEAQRPAFGFRPWFAFLRRALRRFFFRRFDIPTRLSVNLHTSAVPADRHGQESEKETSVARSWDARVKGASQKVDPTEASEADVVDHGARSPESTGPTRPATAGTDEIEAKPVVETAAVERTPVDAVEVTTEEARSGLPDLVASLGMAAAIESIALPMVAVARSTGLIHWMSDTWADRFGEKAHLASYLPSSAELGESPLPLPNHAWQRARSMRFADNSEDIVDLLLLGTSAPDGTEIVTVVATERSDAASVVADRAEAISFVDRALADAAEGSVAVLYVDLDRFKVVHDLVGNIEALRLLDLVSRRIAATVRGTDLLFRLPSDEFAIVACEVEHTEMAEQLAERVRAAVADLSEIGHELALTASVGVAISDDRTTGDELVSAAETAVYLAKGRGRNRVAVHDEELRTRSQRLLVVERQLRRAIEHRDVRFAYQPVVHLPTGSVVGAEALLRLGGDVGLSAVEVVAAAEHSGLMGILGSLVLEGVEEQLGDLLRDSSNEQLIMINLSATQLADDGLTATLQRLVDDPDIPDGRLGVEVPEVVVREHHAGFMRLVELVRPKFKIGVDGFGTSYSSVEILDGLGIDYVKLHRSLTTSVGSKEDTRAEIGALISKANTRGITVVALGVERQDQALILQSLGCPMAQGFFYAGAVTANDLRELVASGFADDRPTRI